MSEFYDYKNFPYGFRKSGDFTISEAEMLSQSGKRLLQLETGSVDPCDSQEEAFVAMCQGKRDAQSHLERVWAKYKKLSQGRKFYSLSRSPDSSVVADMPMEDDEL